MVTGKTADFLDVLAKATVKIEENHRKLAEGLSGVVKDLGPVVNSSIRLKHSIDEAKPGIEELVQVTRKNASIIAKDLQTLDAKVPGFFTDFNMGLDLANTFMDSANKITSHKIDIPAAAINVGNVDLSNALRDLGGDPSRVYDRKDDGDVLFVLGMTPIIGTGKEIGQLIKGEDLVTGQKYDPEDYVWGTVSTLVGGSPKIVGRVFGKYGELEQKAKDLGKVSKVTEEIGWSMPRGGGVIDGRKYTEHALERMAPDTIQVRAELTKRARERAERNGYTFGSKEYMEELKKVDPRGVTPSVVEETIKHATKKPGNKPGLWQYDGKDVRVVLNDKGDVVSVVPNKS